MKYISHLDIMRLWQRALRRAGISLAYSQGFNPRPKISLAVPLAVGVTSEAELMDIFTARWVSPHAFIAAMSRQLPPGIEVLQVNQVPPTLPSLQSQARFAEYTVEVSTERENEELEEWLERLLAMERLPWHHQRDTGRRDYDLRALIDDLWLIDCHEGIATIGMRLVCDNTGSGRPEQVVAALGLEGYPHALNRTRLILKVA